MAKTIRNNLIIPGGSLVVVFTAELQNNRESREFVIRAAGAARAREYHDRIPGNIDEQLKQKYPVFPSRRCLPSSG